MRPLPTNRHKISLKFLQRSKYQNIFISSSLVVITKSHIFYSWSLLQCSSMDCSSKKDLTHSGHWSSFRFGLWRGWCWGILLIMENLSTFTSTIALHCIGLMQKFDEVLIKEIVRFLKGDPTFNFVSGIDNTDLHMEVKKNYPVLMEN